MTELNERLARGDLGFLDLGELAEWIVRQRWFGAKAREVSQIGVLDAVPVASDAPPLVLALIETRFGPGTHETYQVPISVGPPEDVPEEARIAELDGLAVYDALGERREPPRLLSLLASRAVAEADEGRIAFHWVEGYPTPSERPAARPVGSEQTNSSVVFDDGLIVKAYRRIEAGINPELELLRFLSERGFRHIAPLAGWYEYSGRLIDATLGVAQGFVVDARDGWELVLEQLATDADSLLEPLADLGRVSGEMHAVLASDPADPTFAPEEPSAESLALLTATVDEQIERVFVDLPDDERVATIAHRGDEVRDQLRLLANVGTSGRVVRTHGDYHLGQTLYGEAGWTLLDFEGEPARPLPERRRKHSPLRDVAGMMRSFAYAASASGILRGVPAPAGWEARARDRFLDGYLETVDPSLLPPTRSEIEQMLSVYELEKAVYELRYELNNRPDWVGIPVAGIARLLEVPVT